MCPRDNIQLVTGQSNSGQTYQITKLKASLNENNKQTNKTRGHDCS